MAVYLALEDLQLATPAQTLIWLSADDPAATEPNMDVVNEAMSYADNLIDGHLRGRYTLPLPGPVPPLLSDIGVNLARHWLYARRPEGVEVPEAVTRLYKGALDMLGALRDGRVTLGVGAVDAPLPASVRVRSAPRLFGDAELEAY